MKNKIFLLFSFKHCFFYSCTNANKSEENLKKLDKIYGYCDNPHREISGERYDRL